MVDKTQDSLEPEDPTILTDADWKILNDLRDQTPEAIQRALMKRGIENPECFSRIIAAFHPTKTREAVLDAAAELGLDDDDIREMIRNIESPSKRSH